MATSDPIPGGETAMRMLQRDFDVETRYGGGFVQSINGVAGGREDGRPVDWFYYVNGILADQGAAAHELAPGDDIWWDHHDWGGAATSARSSARSPSRSSPASTASGCRCGSTAPPAPRLSATRSPSGSARRGVKAGRSAAGGFGGVGVLRVKVGRWADIRDDPAVRRLEEGPRVRASSRGRPRPATRSRCSTRGRGRAHARAGRRARRRDALGGEAPTWIVTGTDDVGVAAAAARSRGGRAGDRFAIAVEDGRPTPLPLLPPPETP